MTTSALGSDTVAIADPTSNVARVHLVNPSDVSFGVAVNTPRWLYVLAAATGTRWGDPHLVDETLDPIAPTDVSLRVAHAVSVTVDFEKWAAHDDNRERQVHGVPITRHWLIPEHQRPKLYSPHPVMSLEDIRGRTQRAWDRFTVGATSGDARVSSRPSRPGSPSCWCPDCIDRCTPTPGSPRTARASLDLLGAPVGSGWRLGDCS